MADEIYPTETTKTYLRAKAGLPPLPAKLPEVGGPSIQSRWKDLIESVERMSTTELAEKAVGALGPGILKPQAIAKILATGGRIFPKGTLGAEAVGKKLWPFTRGTLRAPQKSLSDIKGIKVVNEPLGTFLADYVPGKELVRLNIGKWPTRESSLWHELVHARQFKDIPHEEAMEIYRRLSHPLERHAEIVSEALAGGRVGVRSEVYNEAYTQALQGLLEPGWRYK